MVRAVHRGRALLGAADAGPANGRTENSLFFEDKLLLKVRIARLRNPHAYSQAQPSWCQHVSAGARHRGSGRGHRRRGDRAHAFLYAESQRDHQEIYAGVAWHHLKRASERLAIDAQESRTAQLRSRIAFAAALSIARECRDQ